MSPNMGLGIDIIEIKRIKNAIEKSDRFKNRVYTSEEIIYCESKGKNKYFSYAGIYSAKEAFVKALGTGFRNGTWQEIEIKHDDLGAPYLEIKGIFLQEMEKREYKNIKVSISHSKEYATSQVILI